MLVSMAPHSVSDPTTGKRGESSAYLSNLLGGYSMHMHGYSFNRDYDIVKLQSWGRNNIINLKMLIPLNCHQFYSKLIRYPLFSRNRIPHPPKCNILSLHFCSFTHWWYCILFRRDCKLSSINGSTIMISKPGLQLAW